MGDFFAERIISGMDGYKDVKRRRKWRAIAVTAAMVGLIALALSARIPVYGQSPGSHYISDGSVTGDLALGYRMRTTEHSWLQPVRFLLPDKTKIAVASDEGFLTNERTPGLFAFRPGEVYRLKITDVPYDPAAELFPTLEVLNRLWPPAGKELEFPVEVVLTQEDLELAARGNLVTRVVYLERSLDALPVDSSLPEGRLLIDVPLGLSPVSVAETRGKVMAIIRLGSRLPENGPNAADPFYFGLPTFAIPAVDACL